MTPNDLVVDMRASAALEDKEAGELMRDVEFFAERIVEMAKKEIVKPAAARKLDWLKRIAEELGETFETLVLDGRGK